MYKYNSGFEPGSAQLKRKTKRTHRDNADNTMEPLLEAHGLSRKQRQPLESAENNEEGELEEKSCRDSSATLRPQQNAIPSQSPFVSFYNGGKDVTTGHLTLFSFPSDMDTP